MERDAKGHFEPIILATAKELAELIREYCRSQRHLWRQIPYLALQAEDEFESKFQRNYHIAFRGYLDVLNYPSIYVDLESGELVTDKYNQSVASDQDVLRFLNNLGLLDAQWTIDLLRSRYENKYPAEYARHEKWRREVAEKYGVQEMYTRSSSTKVSDNSPIPHREPLMVDVPSTLQLVIEQVRLEKSKDNINNIKAVPIHRDFFCRQNCGKI